MAKGTKTTRTGKRNNAEAMRFAHPFFTTVPPADRRNIPGFGRRMTEFVRTKLEKIPKPLREPLMSLDEIIGTDGATAIEKEKSITFHAVGDTGHPHGTMQEIIAAAMAEDFDAGHPERSPAFFLHLGDVIYYNNTDAGYSEQFYAPYKNYPGKIIAIPGNHDGELFKFDGASTGQKKTLQAFMKNFCVKQPSIPSGAVTVLREMAPQPGVYWRLTAPFVDIIGLYSNIAEGPGFIEAPGIGSAQKNWLTKTLAAIKKERDNGKRKALLIAVHHPPYSSGGHDSSVDMNEDINDSCTQSNIMPDAVLAAHAHNYQRYTRFVAFGGKNMEIPFVVAGSGGRGLSTSLTEAHGTRDGNLRYDKSLRDYGYLTVKVTKTLLEIQFTHVKRNKKKEPFDKISVDLQTNRLQ